MGPGDSFEKVWLFGTTGQMLVDKKRADEIAREFSFVRRYSPSGELAVQAVRRLGVKTW